MILADLFQNQRRIELNWRRNKRCECGLINTFLACILFLSIYCIHYLFQRTHYTNHISYHIFHVSSLDFHNKHVCYHKCIKY